MRAAFNIGPSRFAVREVRDPVPGPDEALVRVRACAICGSDKHEFRAERPARIAGHEFAGTVVAFGPGAAEIQVGGGGNGRLHAGDRVIAAPPVGCGRCAACAEGAFPECPAPKPTIGYGRPGAFADYVTVPVRNLLPMAPDLTFAAASLAEPAAVGLHAATRTALAGKRCLVVGAGSIGVLVAQAAAGEGAAEVCVADIQPRHLEIAAGLGLQPLHVGHDALPAGSWDVAFECVGGSDAPLTTALDALRKRGELVLVGSGHPGGVPTSRIVSRHLTVYGSSGVNLPELARAHDLIAAGRIQVGPLIAATYPLTQLTAAFAHALTAQKVIVEP